ncbi:unnamed protein product (macronuclear) [Paramecium tetraurelia]|uniref:Chromosome undetermined scaffold_1, whole genome shotgun sequence n=1 Tax=Paramecium tetraurelia TaxID=5888 RepID=Q6BFT9_PARTE|nr:hypothetical protein [Paramecium tetraurelia strain d4-2]XP_001423182.1 uncharacterized protein GSPATT00000219001 [Paramecium tetraurelia]CAH03481.1 hypothetical protein PTMB.283c [Paramecium tetraurelia]CAK55784.1 unnamed protein product [Paramecium tetraurelia]|eukprot:XP_001423182.1 hypothetical protein (macronuclear) [Paramecium tetraurelia strain d4-2]
MQTIQLKNLLKDRRELKKQFTLKRKLDITSIPILVRNKSCECLDCGGQIIKQIEEHKINNKGSPKYITKFIAQHEKSKNFHFLQHKPQTTQNLPFPDIVPKRVQQPSSNSNEQPLISPTLEQPKRDMRKLSRLIEKYETTKTEIVQQQYCKTLPDVVQKSKNKCQYLQRQKTQHHSYIKILPIGDEEKELQNSGTNSNHLKNSSQKTPLRNQVYKELNESSILRQLQTPILQKSKFKNYVIIDFADGIKKAMEKIKEMDEFSNNSKIVSTQFNEDTKNKNRGSILLKSMFDCTKLLEKNKKTLKQLDVFVRTKSLNRKSSKYEKHYSPSKNYSLSKIYLPKIIKR